MWKSKAARSLPKIFKLLNSKIETAKTDKHLKNMLVKSISDPMGKWANGQMDEAMKSTQDMERNASG